MKKVPIIKKRIKGALGMTYFNSKNKATRIEIDIKKHKGDKKELAATVKHELMHAANPNMLEKTVTTRSVKSKLQPGEEAKMLAKLGMKPDFKPGDMITKMNEQKKEPKFITTNQPLSEKQIAIRGLV